MNIRLAMDIHIKFTSFPSETRIQQETFIPTASLFVQNRLQKSTSSFSNRSLICLTWISWLAECSFIFCTWWMLMIFVVFLFHLCHFVAKLQFSGQFLGKINLLLFSYNGSVCVSFTHTANAFVYMYCLTESKRSLPHFNGFFLLSTNLRLCFYRPSICRFGNGIASIRQIRSFCANSMRTNTAYTQCIIT